MATREPVALREMPPRNIPRREAAPHALALRGLERTLWGAGEPGAGRGGDGCVSDGVVFDMLTYAGSSVPPALRAYVLGTLEVKTLLEMYRYMMCTLPTREKAGDHDSKSFVCHIVDLADAIEKRGFTITVAAVRTRRADAL